MPLSPSICETKLVRLGLYQDSTCLQTERFKVSDIGFNRWDKNLVLIPLGTILIKIPTFP